MFLELTNFYCQFIEAFSKIVLGFLDILKGGMKGKFRSMKFVLTGEALKSFNKLKYFFVWALMLVYYNLMHCIMLEYNASGFAILVILS